MRYFRSRKSTTILLFTLLHTPLVYAVLSPPPKGETPASLSCIYGLTPYVPGCPINGTTAVPNTGSGAIAIIDGQDDPNAFTELQQFSTQFRLNSLPQCNASNSNAPCFQQYYVDTSATPPCISAPVAQSMGNNASTYGIKPADDIEPELDIEWAHAMAPFASIYMIETQNWGIDTDPNNPDISSLVNGLQCATYLLQTYNGGGIISYSHSFQEWAGETAYDAYFQTPGIIYIASSGDYSAPARYPATSPYVIAAGGTSIVRDASGKYIKQVAWHDSSSCTSPPCKTGGTGGPSLYEPRPAYQNSVQKIVGSKRGSPDISFAAEGIDVFCCQLTGTNINNNCCGGTKPSCESVSMNLCASGFGAWVTTGGTSLASPALAGIINSANSGATTTTHELSFIYNNAIKNYHSFWTDITSGNNGHKALVGYDFTTGLGVPRGYGGK